MCPAEKVVATHFGGVGSEMNQEDAA